MSRRQKKHSRGKTQLLSERQHRAESPPSAASTSSTITILLLFFEMLKGNSALVKQILPPLIIRVPHQAHDVATGVEIERARFSRRLHVGFVRQLIAFTAVAGMAARDKILPSRQSASGTWNHMIQREFAGGQRGAAILAGIAVAQQNVLSRQRSRLVWDAAILQESNH